MKQSSPITRHPGYGARSPQGWYVTVKAALDLVLGFLLLVFLSPIILVCAALVKLTSRGPAFYSQTRVGKNGRHFQIIKLRSMRQNAEAHTGAVWSTGGNDSRVTPVGRFLRMTHLDEFPQLINVVKGEMSLVGPRPERPEFVHGFEMQIDHYSSRQLVKPGITGIAQLRLPPDTDLQSVCEKLEFDLYYVRHMSPWLDFVTVLGTAMQLVTSVFSAVIPANFWVPTQDIVRKDLATSARQNTPSKTGHTPAHSIPVRSEQSFPDPESSGVFSVT